MEREHRPTYDFDGLPLPDCAGSPECGAESASPPAVAEPVAIRVHIPDDGADAAEAMEESTPLAQSERSRRARTVSEAALSVLSDAELTAVGIEAHAKLAHVEAQLKRRGIVVPALQHHHAHTNHTSALNPSHLTHGDGTNMYATPVVPVEEALGTVQHVPTPVSKAHRASRSTKANGTRGAHALEIENGTAHSRESESVMVKPAPPPVGVCAHVSRYFQKWQGQHVATPPRSSLADNLLAFVASFVGIAVPALLHYNMLDVAHAHHFLLLVASFGASAVLLYSVPQSDLAQPRNVLGGHLVSALVGVCVRAMIPLDDFGGHEPTPTDPDFAHFIRVQWLACALAVSIAITLMALTRTTHPPGGATALIPVLASATVQRVGWLYILFIGAGICVMILIALITNNIGSKKIWPKFWY